MVESSQYHRQLEGSLATYRIPPGVVVMKTIQEEGTPVLEFYIVDKEIREEIAAIGKAAAVEVAARLVKKSCSNGNVVTEMCRALRGTKVGRVLWTAGRTATKLLQ